MKTRATMMFDITLQTSPKTPLMHRPVAEHRVQLALELGNASEQFENLCRHRLFFLGHPAAVVWIGLPAAASLGLSYRAILSRNMGLMAGHS
jgi:hypothetical protein